jgi:hypothetical protein
MNLDQIRPFMAANYSSGLPRQPWHVWPTERVIVAPEQSEAAEKGKVRVRFTRPTGETVETVYGDVDPEELTPVVIEIVDHASPFDPNGWYIVVGDEILGIAQCAECAENGDLAGAALAGDFWEPISYHHETDTPVHCDSCEALIVTGLTPEGRDYVSEAVLSRQGRPEVLDAWAIAFLDMKDGAF